MQKKLILSNNIEEVPRLTEFIELACEEWGLDMETTMSLNLALEEAVVNSMTYAYPQGTKGDVCIEASAGNGQIEFVLSDNGAPFDPTTKEDVDTTLSAEQRPIGGLGIFLIKQIMDSISYERKGETNILTLRKNIRQ